MILGDVLLEGSRVVGWFEGRRGSIGGLGCKVIWFVSVTPQSPWKPSYPIHSGEKWILDGEIFSYPRTLQQGNGK